MAQRDLQRLDSPTRIDGHDLPGELAVEIGRTDDRAARRVGVVSQDGDRRLRTIGRRGLCRSTYSSCGTTVMAKASLATNAVDPAAVLNLIPFENAVPTVPLLPTALPFGSVTAKVVAVRKVTL